MRREFIVRVIGTLLVVFGGRLEATNDDHLRLIGKRTSY